MDFLIFLKHGPEVGNIVFKVPSLIGILSMEVCVSLFVFHLLFDIFLMESNHSLLELLEVSNMVQAFKNVVLKFLLV
jgi:hypothetical protein